MRKLPKHWWLVATLILMIGLAGHVQAQGGWAQFVQQIVHSVQRTTRNLVALFSTSESARDAIKPEAVPTAIPDSSPIPQTASAPSTTPAPSTPQYSEPTSGWWEDLIRSAVTDDQNPSEEVSITAFAPDPTSDWSETTDWSETADLPDLQDFLTPPVPSYWDWDDEDWMEALTSEFDEQQNFDVEWFQEQIRQEIKRQSEGAIQNWEMLEQLDDTFEEFQLSE